MPAGLTDANDMSELDHVNTRPSRGFPLASSATAESADEAPLASEILPGLTETLVIGAGPVGPSEHERREAPAKAARSMLEREIPRMSRQYDRYILRATSCVIERTGVNGAVNPSWLDSWDYIRRAAAK